MTSSQLTTPIIPSRKAALFTAGLLFAAGALVACGADTSQTNAASACTALMGTKIPASSIGLPTKGGQVTAATFVPENGNGAKGTAEYCQVDAALRPVDPIANNINMRIALPTNWNSKSWMIGGGGYNGSVRATNRWDAPVGGQPLVSRGYVVFSSDSGHEGYYTDASFAAKGNDEEMRNYTGEALKKTRDAAMYLMKTRYNKTPDRPYFVGGSTGGREALQVTQQYPADFAGSVAWASAWNAATLDLEFTHLTKIFSQPGAWLNPAKQNLLYHSVMNDCDGNDGARDGLISNPGACHFDPHTLRCPDGADSGDTCLSDAQINAVIEADGPMKLNYPLASGETQYPGFPFLSGMELRTHDYGIGVKPPSNKMNDAENGVDLNYGGNWLRFFVTQNPNFPLLTFDPQNPGPWQQRISDLTKVQDINNPDLSAFAKAGGKLLIVHGTSDEIVSYRSTVDYYNRVLATMGPAAVQDFARLYLIPGYDHLDDRSAFVPQWDFATALDNWVHSSKAPENQVATDLGAEGHGRTRPVCAYPTWPKYNGDGDVNKASSFTCASK